MSTLFGLSKNKSNRKGRKYNHTDGNDIVGLSNDDKSSSNVPQSNSYEHDHSQPNDDDDPMNHNHVNHNDLLTIPRHQKDDQQQQQKEEDETTIFHSTFHTMGLMNPLIQTCDSLGYKKPTPVQRAVIPYLLQERNNHVLVLAETGMSKTNIETVSHFTYMTSVCLSFDFVKIIIILFLGIISCRFFP
jgi:hypothetical protein